ncbi:MAG: coenzyme F430 synthase [Candidatus Methanomethylophilaceae archaeon]
MKILILDTVHGGGILADKYPDAGDDVTCVDVYKVTPKEELDRLKSKGYTVSDKVPGGEYDTVLMPIHCPDSFLDGVVYKERKFFSQAVGELIDDGRFRIEVTGVKGKTSFCCLLAHLLTAAGMKVLVQTSRGRGGWIDGELHSEEIVSIAPPSMLTLPDGDYDAVICEVSLGGSGKANISCITNLIEDYPIAAGTRKASEGKTSILNGKLNIVPKEEVEFWKSRGAGKVIGYGGRIAVMGKPSLGAPLRVRAEYGNGFETSLKGNYLALEYLYAIEMSLEVCEAIGIPDSIVEHGLSSFKGVPGRGEVSFSDGRWIVTERNPGISARSVERTFSTMSQMGALGGAVAVLDPVNRKVCCKMDSEAIKKVASEYGVEIILTDGSGKMPSLPGPAGTLILFVKEGYT